MVDAVVHYSPSQLETFTRCQRKWWFEKIAGLRSPSTPRQEYGQLLHKQLENWVNTGVDPEDPRATAAKNALTKIYPDDMQRPLHRQSLRTEGEIHLALPPAPTGEARRMIGFVDVADFSGSVPAIWDWKSRSDVKRYAMAEHEVLTDVQMTIYGWYALAQLPAADRVRLGLVYFQNNGAVRERVVSVETTRAHLAEQWQAHLRTIDGMEVARLQTEAATVSPNLSACNDFGGCPHRARCNALEFFPDTVFSQTVADDRTPWFSEADLVKLNPPDSTRRLGNAPSATPLTVDPECLPPVLQKVQKTGERLMNPFDKLAALGNGPVKIDTEQNTSRVDALLAKTRATETSIPLLGPANDADMIGAVPPVPDVPAVEAQLPLPLVEAPVPKKRGRPPGSRNKTVAEDVVDPPASAAGEASVQLDLPLIATQPVVAPTVVEAPTPLAPVATGKTPDLAPTLPTPAPGSPRAEVEAAQATLAAKVEQTVGPKAQTDTPIAFLFLNCVPIHGFSTAVVPFSTWVEPVKESIKSGTGADWQFHEFRKASAELNRWAMRRPLPPAMMVNGESPEWRELQSYIIGKSFCVIQGLK